MGTSHSRHLSSRAERQIAILVLMVAVAVYVRTAYPTITWWDSSSYSLVSATLGVASPPGSLLLTLIGWPFARLTFGLTPAHALNVLAALFGALTVTLVYVVSLRVIRRGRITDPGTAGAAGAALGALTFAFSATQWEYAVKFSPYILTALFTAAILWTLIRWWDEADDDRAWHWLALLSLLFGLDFSVHRTNAMLIPGALAWVLIRRPRLVLDLRVVLGIAAAMAAGLAVQLLIVPIAIHTSSPWRSDAPITLSALWRYVSVARMGGGFLIQFFPRKSDFWHVQVADFIHVFGDNFFDLTILGALPLLASAIGFVTLWRRERRFAVAYTVLLVLQATTTVMYFNIPAHYFRSFDRHYLPICVTFAILIACGLGALVQAAWRWHRRGMHALTRVAPMIPAGTALIMFVIPASRLVANWRAHDASRRYFARDYAVNALSGLPRNAIYFTIGDNDTYPLLYMQAVEGMRPDVTILNLSMLNLPEYVEDVRRRDPSFPIALPEDERAALANAPWPDTAIVIPVRGTAASLGLTEGVHVPDSITLDAKPTNGDHVIPSDVVLLDIVRTNQWRRPLVFATTVGDGGIGWLKPFGRVDGVYWRIVPTADTFVPPDVDALRTTLMDRMEYRGFADPSIQLEDFTRTIGWQYRIAFGALLDAERAAGRTDSCRADQDQLDARVPVARLVAESDKAPPVGNHCQP